MKDDDIKNVKEEDRYMKLKEEFSFFSTRYPMLYEISIRKDDFDWNSLNYFLSMRTKIIEDKITSENASIKVGKEWFDKHIDTSKLHKNKKQRK